MKRILLILLCTIVSIAAVSLFVIDNMNVPPRELSRYLEHRASGHNPLIVNVADWTGKILLELDRGTYQPHLKQLMIIGAQTHTIPTTFTHGKNSTSIFVSSPAETIKAIDRSRPGDIITLMPGTYRFEGFQYIAVSHAGTKTSPITVRAERPETVFLEFNIEEGFHVSAPYWTFENLHIRGICREHSNCEHAFHIIGKAEHFIARNNMVVDFNAHFKINGVNGTFPDDGLIQGNTLTNTSVRQTSNPVVPIDLVAGSHWLIRRNLITDFIKARGDMISFGAYTKGGGSDNLFEENIVLCEQILQGVPGQRIGISLGGGGTGSQFCRDQRCITEQANSVIQSNLVAFCSDDGIYINRAAESKILHNTLIDTGGISVRFVESSADVLGNLVDGLIRTHDGGLLHAIDNFDTSASRLYLGIHPVRKLFVNASTMNFQWLEKPPQREVKGISSPNLCGVSRPSPPTYGAFEDFSTCMTTK